MKKIYIIVLFALILTSCNKFLEEVSNDQIVPKNVSDYKEFLFGEIYNKMNNRVDAAYLDIMTDDCGEFAKKANLGSDTRGSGFGYYCWQKDPEIMQNGQRSTDDTWANFYHNILVCNMILNDIDNMNGSQEEKAQVKAEAYMCRAYAYWLLVNVYGEPYDTKTATTAKGIPINDMVGAENKTFERDPLNKVYEQICSDLTNALKEFDLYRGTYSIYRWNYDAALVFASRVYLYMQNWKEAEKYASLAIANKPNLWDLNDKQENKELSSNRFFCSQNPEILFSYGNYYLNWFASGAKGAYPVSDDLKNSFEKEDLRIGLSTGAFIRYQGSTFFGGGKRYLSYKNTETSETLRHGYAIRTAEAYLNRAEALLNQSKLEEAAKDIDFLRSNRIKKADFKNIAYANKEELTSIVKSERRKELCFEQHRWFDLRRWDRPSIEHTYTPNFVDLATKVVYVLEKDDPAYTLPLPNYIVEKDPKTENIKRPDRTPKK